MCRNQTFSTRASPALMNIFRSACAIHTVHTILSYSTTRSKKRKERKINRTYPYRPREKSVQEPSIKRAHAPPKTRSGLRLQSFADDPCGVLVRGHGFSLAMMGLDAVPGTHRTWAWKAASIGWKMESECALVYYDQCLAWLFFYEMQRCSPAGNLLS